MAPSTERDIGSFCRRLELNPRENALVPLIRFPVERHPPNLGSILKRETNFFKWQI